MARPKVERVTRPSGVIATINGKYFYWNCTVSGLQTFADADRFKEVVEKFGSEENLVKTYVLRPVQKYLDAGFSPEAIKGIIAQNEGKLPPLDSAPIVEAPKAEVNPTEHSIATVSQSVDIPEVLLPKKEVVYPWSGNPDYFKGAVKPLSIEEETKEACMYPNRRLDTMCRECSVYDRCSLPTKYTEEDWRKPKNEVKIRVMVRDAA